MNTLEIKARSEMGQSLNHSLKKVWLALRPLALPVLVGGTLVFGVLSGFVAARLPPRLAQLALAGLAFFFVTLVGIEYVLLLLLAMSSTLIQVQSLPFLFGFSSVELCVMFLLGLIVAKGLKNKREGGLVRTPLDWPILLFFVAGTISLLHAIYFQETVFIFRNSVWRALLVYLVFFAVTNLIRTRRQLMTLVGGMFVMATLVAAFMIAQQAVGPGFSIIPGQQYVRIAMMMDRRLEGVARLNIPGTAIVYLMLLPALILHATPEFLRGRKWLSFIPAVLLPLAIAITLSRNLWIGATVGGVVFVLVSRLKSRRFVLLILSLALGAAVLVSLLNAYYPRIDIVVQGLTARFDSLFAGDELLYDSSTQWRLQENEAAMPKIREQPILGVGPSGKYRAPWSSTDRLTNYIHNAYLYLLIDTGIIGFIPFLWFSIAFLARGVVSWHNLKNPITRSLVIGFTVSYVAILSASTVTPKLLESEYVPLIALILGFNEAAIRLDQESTQ